MPSRPSTSGATVWETSTSSSSATGPPGTSDPRSRCLRQMKQSVTASALATPAILASTFTAAPYCQLGNLSYPGFSPADLREVLLAGDRERPLVTGANGPLMARRAVGVGAALDSSLAPQPVTVNSGYDLRHLAARQFNSFCSNWPVAVR